MPTAESSASPAERHMAHALDLARRGEGRVEPNPMVGCVVARGTEVLGSGWHQRFGGPHAEVEALNAAGTDLADATLYVTLEPCCHTGKTPPCTEAILQRGLRRVVIAMADPFAQVGGRGIEQLKAAGIQVEVGCLEAQALELNRPYLKRINTGKPWVVAKWAMTLDGKIASATGDSQWISGEASRGIVHQLRGRVDAVVIGRETARRDDPLLTARPPGPRIARRVVLDRAARLPLDSKLVQTSHEAPVQVVTQTSRLDSEAARQRVDALRDAGCEILTLAADDSEDYLHQWLLTCGSRGDTNLLVEGGGALLGALFAARQVDEVHTFVAPKIIGGHDAVTPVAGTGVEKMAEAWQLPQLQVEQIEQDVYLHGRLIDSPS